MYIRKTMFRNELTFERFEKVYKLFVVTSVRICRNFNCNGYIC